MKEMLAAVSLREKESASSIAGPSSSGARAHSERSSPLEQGEKRRKIERVEKFFMIEWKYEVRILSLTEVLSSNDNTLRDHNGNTLEHFVRNALVLAEWLNADPNENTPTKIARLDESKPFIPDYQGQQWSDGEDAYFYICRGRDLPDLVIGRSFMLNELWEDVLLLRDWEGVTLRDYVQHYNFGDSWVRTDRVSGPVGAEPVEVSCVRKVNAEFLDFEYNRWLYSARGSFSVERQSQLWFLVTGSDDRITACSLRGLWERFGLDVIVTPLPDRENTTNDAALSETLEAFALGRSFGDACKIEEIRIEKIKRASGIMVFKDVNYNRYSAAERNQVQNSFLNCCSVVPKNPAVFLVTSTGEEDTTHYVLSEKEIHSRYDVNMISAGQELGRFLDSSTLGDEWVSGDLRFESVEQIDENLFCTLRYQHWQYTDGDRRVIQKNRQSNKKFFVSDENGVFIVYSESYLLQNLPQKNLVTKQYLEPYDTLRNYLAECNIRDISRYPTYICVGRMVDIFFKREEKLQYGQAFQLGSSFFLITNTVEDGKYVVVYLDADAIIDAPTGYSQIYPYIRDREIKRMRPRG